MGFDADHVVETFHAASDESKLSSLREHQVVHLPADGEVWMTGDLHDHRPNFDKLLKAADLAKNPQRHLVLHELIHGDYFDANHAEGSWLMLFRAAELKEKFPEQVHFLLANHDLAQIHGEGIMKAGFSVCEAFTAGVRRDFGDKQWDKVNYAISEFLPRSRWRFARPTGCSSVTACLRMIRSRSSTTPSSTARSPAPITSVGLDPFTSSSGVAT
jgi:hypothetical protein